MKEYVRVSIQPSFFCNFNCDYCYLGRLRKNKQILSLDILRNRIKEISNYYSISSIQLLGGEISLLDEQYFLELYNIIKDFNVSVSTNLSNTWLVNFCLQRDIRIGVSLNEERPYYKETLAKLKTLKRLNCITLSSVVLSSLLNKSPKEILDFYEELGFPAYFIQYHPSIYSKYKFNTNIEIYSNFINNLIKEYKFGNYKFVLGNELSLTDTTKRFSLENCLFINPDGSLNTIMEKRYGKEVYENFKSIEDFDAFRKHYRSFREIQCFDCPWQYKCQGVYLASANAKECAKMFEISLRNRLI